MPTIPFIPTSLPLRYTDLRPSPRSSAGGGLIITLSGKEVTEWERVRERSERGSGSCKSRHPAEEGFALLSTSEDPVIVFRL